MIVDRNSLRKSKLGARDLMEPALRKEKSNRICALLTAHPVITDADHLFVYVDFRSEVETMDLIRDLIAAGKTISVPVTLLKKSRLQAVRLTNPDTQLMPGCYGIPEPSPDQITKATVDPATIDTVLIPGSVFDTGGGRLGYGGGYYDRFLTESAPRAARVGVAFELQLVDQVPMEPHDQYMDVLVTEQQIYDCGRNRHA
ncbi:MAG: 5-formyltetrahydrofolate cyclo-ligase [Thermodesulfobacteriota bacterium]|nr:5-formyltetrahydrofolate cyclo-ligase [Thermodesulfobacteriota bacterium]